MSRLSRRSVYTIRKLNYSPNSVKRPRTSFLTTLRSFRGRRLIVETKLSYFSFYVFDRHPGWLATTLILTCHKFILLERGVLNVSEGIRGRVK